MTTSRLITITRDCRKRGVGPAAAVLLLAICDNPEGCNTLGALARQIGVSTAAITGLADCLVKLGYAEREHSAEDRREIWLTPTDKGRELVGMESGVLS